MAATQNSFLWFSSGWTEIHPSAIMLPFKNLVDFNLPGYYHELGRESLCSEFTYWDCCLQLSFSPSIKCRFASLAAVSSLNFGHVPRHWGSGPRLPVSVSSERQQSLGDQLAQWPIWICKAPGVRWVGHSEERLMRTGAHLCSLYGVLSWVLIKTLILNLVGIQELAWERLSTRSCH